MFRNIEYKSLFTPYMPVLKAMSKLFVKFMLFPHSQHFRHFLLGNNCLVTSIKIRLRLTADTQIQSYTFRSI